MSVLEFFKVLLLGIVEGITEWLPISSTGHLLLLDNFIELDATQAFKDVFMVVIQLGAILAVIALYFHKLNPFSLKKTKEEKKDTMDIWFKVIVGSIPAVVGVFLDDLIEEKLSNCWVIASTLIIYGIIFIFIEGRKQNQTYKVEELSQLSYKTAFLIGIFQVLAMIPGTSRSGATIIGAMLMGTSRYVAAEYTFFLAIPAMFGASFLRLVKYFMHNGMFQAGEWAILLTGMVVAFVVSILAIKFLMNYIKNNDFKVFGYYRIVLGIVIIAYFAAYTL
ncbi:MAG: undecaprenyl-diphosphate phosphatase [Lachnospiraceae bacterium]|mgnify:CR=1 FL=1|nr:undecaprenyl-diphosphate phosphatase [Lachnospiraceae bacterium]MEE1342870.1 undecaprenyl-diphosphate phosphatase [Lachnospiraceae bacterium]